MAVSAFSQAHAADRNIAEINITPLVDVMLVLLIIFMVSAPVMTHELPMTLPRPSPDADPVPPERLQLRVRADGSFVLDGALLSLPQLRRQLATVARRSPASVLEIRAESEADYQGFTFALSAARRSGLRNIALSQ